MTLELEQDDKELDGAIGVVNDALTNGSKNGKEVARRVLGVITPILLRSPDPRIKALAIALGIASRVFLKKKTRRTK